MRTDLNRLEIVLKITERCNINCTYCYMFNKGNIDYLSHPAYIAEDTVAALASFIEEGVRDLSIKDVLLIMHGGEPLMLKPERFDKLCELLRERLESICNLRLALQTNGMLVTPGWIRLFAKHRVSVGVSIDGPPEYNDIERLDHKGGGTYSATVAGFAELQRAAKLGIISDPGVLCVIDPNRDARKIYRHFREALGASAMNFIFPIESRDSETQERASLMTRYLSDLFDEWRGEDNPDVDIRLLKEPLRYFAGGTSSPEFFYSMKEGDGQIIAVGTSGDLGPDDALKPLNLRFPATANVARTSLREFINSVEMSFVHQIDRSTPDNCLDCCWQKCCRAGISHGRAINRFSKHSGFNNASVYCNSLRKFYSTLASYFLSTGGNREALEASLDPDVSIPAVRPPNVPQEMLVIPIKASGAVHAPV